MGVAVCLEHGWTITRTFRGVSSGRDGTRGLLETLLAKLRETRPGERPNRVLMTRLDRLGRGLGIEALAAIAEIVRLGVTIHTRQDGDYRLARKHSAPSTPAATPKPRLMLSTCHP
jgi:DNA invertase Pin-like site-specific DNA recombinase